MNKKEIQVFDIPNQKFLGIVSTEGLNKKYDSWRAKGYGVLIDRDGCICLDNEDSSDDGQYYKDQLEDLNELIESSK